MDDSINSRADSTVQGGRLSGVKAFGKARAAVTAWFAGLMTGLADGVSRAAINRRVIRRLSLMSDRELNDIGLVRQDVLDSEARLPESDALNFLRRRREQRRSGRLHEVS